MPRIALRRTLTTAALFAVTGALVSWCVAAAAAYHGWRAGPEGRWREETMLGGDLEAGAWLFEPPAGQGRPMNLRVYTAAGFQVQTVLGESSYDLPELGTVGPPGYWQAEVRTGWPWKAFRAWEHPGAVGMAGALTFQSAQADAVTGKTDIAVPYLPVWPGLIADTCLWGAAAWALWRSPGAARRWHRRRQGRCPRCGYDRRGMPAAAPCPECGGAQ